MSAKSPHDHPNSPRSPSPLPPPSPQRLPSRSSSSLSRSNPGAHPRPPSSTSGALSSQSSHEAGFLGRPIPLSTSSHSATTTNGTKALSRPRKRRRTAEEEEVALGHSLLGTSSEKLYTFDKKLGEGTFGEVHLAIHKETKARVALKRILVHSETDGVPITTIREIKLLKQLSHVNVVPVVDMVLTQGDETNNNRGKIYMVFPYMDHDLAGLLQNPEVTLSHSHIKLYAQQLLTGTAYLHANHIVHRDMKSANLLIDNEGCLKIADFGLARTYDKSTSRGGNKIIGGRDYTNMVVTRWYRPPELLLGCKQYGPSIDMWGVGCVIAEMYRKHPILQGNTDPEQLVAIYQLCGTPSEEALPGFDTWGGCEGQLMLPPIPLPRRVIPEFSSLSNELASLLDGLLCMDPAKRTSANEALEHPFFWVSPLPAKLGSLPHYSPSHEMTHKPKAAPRPVVAMPPTASGRIPAFQATGQPSFMVPPPAPAPPFTYVGGPPPPSVITTGPTLANQGWYPSSGPNARINPGGMASGNNLNWPGGMYAGGPPPIKVPPTQMAFQSQPFHQPTYNQFQTSQPAQVYSTSNGRTSSSYPNHRSAGFPPLASTTSRPYQQPANSSSSAAYQMPYKSSIPTHPGHPPAPPPPRAAAHRSNITASRPMPAGFFKPVAGTGDKGSYSSSTNGSSSTKGVESERDRERRIRNETPAGLPY
ncbi:pkinase-domain-containing protein [Phaffia rhodozyma]|uniref:Pkinase-domain-containing protein n=1 Tax=Phaffia rhodozyma TaxID=264483 RepID=A0A0F7SSL2_PHARH|nr:pkinase-domain-containing protein [Phaffia rhodozyma]